MTRRMRNYERRKRRERGREEEEGRDGVLNVMVTHSTVKRKHFFADSSEVLSHCLDSL